MTDATTDANRAEGVERLSGPRRESISGNDPGTGTFVVGWAVGWAVVGVLVGLCIAVSLDEVDLEPVLILSVPFAEVVGMTALVSTRVVFPALTRLPAPVRLFLQVATIVAGTVAGSLAVLALRPFFALARPRAVVLIVLLNAALAVVTGLVLNAFEGMKRQIRRQYDALREKETLERELQIAREVQRELLPKASPPVRGLELAGSCRAAVGVGGDLFDYIPLGPDRVGIVVADVSGKGIPAALLMASIQASVRSLAVPDVAPCDLAVRLNGLVHDTTSAARYATLFFGWYDGTDGTLQYCNAGHFPPIVVGAVPDEAPRETLGVSGRPIGILDDSTYSDGTVRLKRGDVLALFTDGVVEAPSHDGEEFGPSRLAAAVYRRTGQPLDLIVDGVLEDVARWTDSAAPHDDITLVLARAT